MQTNETRGAPAGDEAGIGSLAEPDTDMIKAQGKFKEPRKSTSVLTMNLLRSKGFTCCNVEHYNVFAGVRNDLFGCIDIAAVKPGELLFVQTTSWAHVADRRRKIQGIPAAGWLAALPQVKVIIMGWRKVGARWQHKEEEYHG